MMKNERPNFVSPKPQLKFCTSKKNRREIQNRRKSKDKSPLSFFDIFLRYFLSQMSMTSTIFSDLTIIHTQISHVLFLLLLPSPPSSLLDFSTLSNIVLPLPLAGAHFLTHLNTQVLWRHIDLWSPMTTTTFWLSIYQ